MECTGVRLGVLSSASCTRYADRSWLWVGFIGACVIDEKLHKKKQVAENEDQHDSQVITSDGTF